MDLYVKNIKKSDDHDLFYTDPDVINAYKNYISQIIGRYKNSPAVFAWELANEVACPKLSYSSNKSLTKLATGQMPRPRLYVCANHRMGRSDIDVHQKP